MASPKCMEHNGASQKLEHPLNSPFLQCFRGLSEDPLLLSPPAVFPVGNVQWSAVVKPDGDTPELGWVGVKTDPSVWTPSTAFTSTSSTFTGVVPGVLENLGYVTVGEVTEGGMVVVWGFPQNKLHHWPLTGEKTRKKSARERCAGSIICLRLSQVDALWSVWAQILHTCKHIGKEDAEGPIMRSYFLQRAEVIQVIQGDETKQNKKWKNKPFVSCCLSCLFSSSLWPLSCPVSTPPDISSLHNPTLLFLCVIIDSPYFGGGTLHHSWLDLIFLSCCLADKKIRAFVNKASILHLLPCIYCHFCDHTCGLNVMTHTDCYKAETQWEWGTTMWSTRKYHPHGRMCVTN